MISLFPESVVFLEAELKLTKNKFSYQKQESNSLLQEAALTLGISLTNIERDLYGAPILSDNLIGTTSHSETKIIAAVTNVHQGIGVDLQKIKKVNPNLKNKILTPVEQYSLKDELELLKIFSIKESIYKAYYIATKERLTWKSVSISINDYSYSASFNEISKDIQITGKIIVDNNFIYSSCYTV